MSLYVNHPRYGCKPIRSGYQYSVTEIKNSYWRYKHVKFLVGTAIPANTEKQNYGVYPREKYIDIEELCEVCNRPFIFFALEQKYWFCFDPVNKNQLHVSKHVGFALTQSIKIGFW